MEAPNPSGRRSNPVVRHGPLVVVVVAVVVFAALAIVRSEDDPTTEAGAGQPADMPTVDLPVTFARAQEEGLDVDFGDRCDPETGRLRMPSLGAPPCVPVFAGDNGGATHRGVTADEIVVVRYVAPENGDLAALLQGINDPADAQKRTTYDYAAMLDDIYETYGRRVRLVDLEGSGPGDDEVAARNDAVEVAEDIGAFASLGGPGMTHVYAEELAKRGVLCIGCGLASPDSTVQANAPYMWGVGATPEEYLTNLGDFVVGRLVGRPASRAGDPAMRERERVFGVVHFEQDPPVFSEVSAAVDERGEERGYVPAAQETYTLDLGKLPERAATIVAKLKQAGVTTVIFLGDPLMPIYLTKAATEQQYFPEWVVTGTVFTDTTAFGRQYDPQQWDSAFGISTLPVRMPREQNDGNRLYEWYYGRESEAPTTGPVALGGLSLLFTGIHLAGPDLNPETFRAAMFSAPPYGGGPTTPYVSFGMNGFYELADGSPRPDYLAVDDMAEIWWDPDAEGVDESGKEGRGMWRYVDGGRRFLPGQLEPGELQAGVVEGTVTAYDASSRPESDRPPSYPPWPGSPAAG